MIQDTSLGVLIFLELQCFPNIYRCSVVASHLTSVELRKCLSLGIF